MAKKEDLENKKIRVKEFMKYLNIINFPQEKYVAKEPALVD